MSEELNENLRTFEGDLLGRRNIAINLTNIIKNKSDLRVLAIDSSWGTGKTTFIKMWMNMIENDQELGYGEELEVMCFNAWENDYIQEPLVSILSELNDQIKDKTDEGEEKSFFEIHEDKFKLVGKVLLGATLKYATGVGLEQIGADKHMEAAGKYFSDNIGKQLFERAEQSKSAKSQLKKALNEFQGFIGKKVIIFIDELDRCRPTYAVELLETIKHIFDIENYIFVIALDKEQLSHSIKTLYGQGMDSDGYLRRFFDLEYSLPQSGFKEYIKIKNKELNLLYNNIDYFSRMIEEIFYYERYSLRDINKAYQYMGVLLPNLEIFNSESKYKSIYKMVTSYIYAYFINLKVKHHDILKNIKNLNYKIDKNYIKENLITFDYEKFNLMFNDFHDVKAKEIISDVIELYLELFYNVEKVKGKIFYPKEEEVDKYQIGFRDKDGNFRGWDNYVDLYNCYENIEIIEKMDFLSDFKIE